MLRKISVQELRTGMYLQQVCGAWIDHPFWRVGFVLTDASDIAQLQASRIREVWIDCAKGLSPDTAPTPAEVLPPAAIPVAPERLASDGVAPSLIEVELVRASRICNQARSAVIAMFGEARLGRVVDTGLAQQLVQEITDSVTRNPAALISLARLKTADDYTYMHSVAVCAMMVALARQLGMDEAQVRLAGIAGLMHDLGKATVPLDILNKPGRLSPAEFKIIQDHPAEGCRLLANNGAEIDPVVFDVCMHHHEKMDGSGYPQGISGDQISLFARMGAVCDVYDAITSNRPYKQGWDPAESLRRMAEWSNGHFDRQVFQAFVKSLGIYPTGSLVRLSSGRLGVVIEQAGKSLTTPRVKVFFSTRSNLRIAPELVDLSLPEASEKIVGREDPARWQFGDISQLWSGGLS